MSAVLVRHNGSATHNTSSTTWSFTPAAGYSAGDVALLALHLEGNASVSSVTDSLGNTYVSIFTVQESTTSRCALFACYNTAAGTPTLTVTLSVAVTAKEADVSEWSGITSPVDVTATNAATTGTSVSTGTTAAAQSGAGGLAVAVYGLNGTGEGAATITPASGYTSLAEVSNPGLTTDRLSVHYRVVQAGDPAAAVAVATTSATTTYQSSGIAVFPPLFSPLGALTLASSSQLSGTLTGNGFLGALTLAADSGLYLITTQPLGSLSLASGSTLGGTLGHLGQIATFVDYCPRSGTTYLYKARAVTAQGAYADSAPVSAGIVIASGIYLHVLGQGGTTLHQFLWDVGEKVDRVQPSVAFVQVEGRQYPLAEFDETMTSATLTVNLKCYFDQGVSPPTSTDKKALDTIVYSRGTVCYRDHRGRKTFGAIGDYQVTDLNLAYGVVLTITRSDDSDAV